MDATDNDGAGADCADIQKRHKRRQSSSSLTFGVRTAVSSEFNGLSSHLMTGTSAPANGWTVNLSDHLFNVLTTCIDGGFWTQLSC